MCKVLVSFFILKEIDEMYCVVYNDHRAPWLFLGEQMPAGDQTPAILDYTGEMQEQLAGHGERVTLPGGSSARVSVLSSDPYIWSWVR